MLLSSGSAGKRGDKVTHEHRVAGEMKGWGDLEWSPEWRKHPASWLSVAGICLCDFQLSGWVRK